MIDNHGRPEALEAAIRLVKPGMSQNDLWISLCGAFPLPRGSLGGDWLRNVTDSRLDTLCKEALRKGLV